MNIKYTTGIVALTVDKTIYIHKNLYKYPELYDIALKHEKKHVELKKGWRHWLHDITSFGLLPKFAKFMLANPDSMLHFLPVNKIEGHWVICYYDIVCYILLIIIWSVIFIKVL